MLKHLEALCHLCGASGNEQEVRAYIQQAVGGLGECTVDPLGNLLVLRRGRKRPEKKLMLSAHMDEVGMIVTSIRSDGSLTFGAVGGVDPSVMIGRQVLVGDDRLPGVIGAKAVHKLTAAQRDQAPTCDMLSIDIGAADADQAKRYIRPGDFVHFLPNYRIFGDGMIASKALDDRAGCAILLDLLEREPEYDTWFAFLVQEEVGLRGAMTAAHTIAPDYAIVLETTTASDIPDVSGAKRVCALGAGAVVSFMDRSTLYDRELYRLAFASAEAEQIPVQTKTMIAGGNDSGAIHISGKGVRTLAISAPCRYLHSPSCVLAYRDLCACAQLAGAMMKRIWQL